MFVYVVLEFVDYNSTNIVKVFYNEEKAEKYVEEHMWLDSDGCASIFYEKHNVE